MIDTILIRGHKNFENFYFLNLIEIKIKDNQFLDILKKHKQIFYHFIPVGLLFSSSIKSKTNQIFIVCNRLGNLNN